MSAALAIARLLDTLEALGTIARHMHPPRLDALVASLGDRDAALRAAMADAEWPEPLREPAERAGEATLRACDGLRAAVGSIDGPRQSYRALRQVSRALEALYPLAAVLPTVDRFFLTSDDLSVGPSRSDAPTGVLHAGNETSERGGFSVYVPEDYEPSRQYPLVMALHGGAGHGRLFLWSWLREVRGRGVILAAPTAIGDTWSLMDPPLDSGNLLLVVEQINQRWGLDTSRLLLTGMSDGGTFCYVTGLESASPFTHLAPVAATFHPLMAEMADAERLRRLPVYLVHGKLDWMFPVQVARQTRGLLSAAGADVTYRELDDLSHTYPREINAEILQWLGGER